MMFFLVIVLPLAVHPEDDSDAELHTTGPGEIIIESGSLELRNKEKTALFKEDVRAQTEDLTIECNEMRVYYNEKSYEGELENAESFIGDIDSILATGNVRITRGIDLSGTAEKAVYDLVEETVTLTGQPVLKQGKNTLKGSSLTYSLKDESVSVTDVKAILYQEKEGVSTGEE
jgi:lipopolysaccharide export system protein LptA